MLNNYILIWILLLSLGGIVILLGGKIISNRRKNVDYTQFGDYSITHLMVDYVAFKIVYWSKQTIAKIYIFALFFLRNSLSVIRYLIIRFEKKFYHFTESMKEKQQIVHKDGSVSSFLKEIKEHKENAMADVQDSDELDFEEEPRLRQPSKETEQQDLENI